MSVTHHIKADPDAHEYGMRDSTGGHPHLPRGQTAPRCENCGEELSLFLQLDVRPEFGLPFTPGSHLLVFDCVHCEDIPIDLYSDQETDVRAPFGQAVRGTYSIVLNPPSDDDVVVELETPITPAALSFEAVEDHAEVREWVGLSSEDFSFRVGGAPSWINHSADVRCSCGSKLVFVCRVPDDHSFKQDGKSALLFLGNFTFIMACEKQCSPSATIAVCDN